MLISAYILTETVFPFMEAKTRQSTSLDAGLMAIVSVGYAVYMYT